MSRSKRSAATSPKAQQATATQTSEFAAASAAAGLTSQAGKGAIDPAYRAMIEPATDARLTHSVDIDTAFSRSEANATRWDYGIGVEAGQGERAYWIEPHPASSTGEVDKMLQKLAWLKQKLSLPAYAGLKKLTGKTQASGNTAFIWTYSGDNRIRPDSPLARKLRHAGLSMPCRRMELK
jgi:hypothetical protein